MRISRLLPFAALLTGCAQKPVPPPQPPVTPQPVGPTVNVPDSQRRATVRVEAALTDEVKGAFVQGIKKSRLPDAIGELGVSWTSRGSGFFLHVPGSDQSIVITNKHVVDSASKVNLLLDEHTTIRDCEVAYVDERYDVAVIKVPSGVGANNITFAQLASAEPQDNDPVQAVGFPSIAGHEQSFRTTSGVVSNSRFTLPGRKEVYLQHTAAIDHGNSGGPLYKKDSLDILGINTLAIPANNNLYSAVPAKTVTEVIKKYTAVPPVSNVEATSKLLSDTCQELMDELSSGGQAPASTVAILSDLLVSDLGVKAWDSTFIKQAPPQFDPSTGDRLPPRVVVDQDAFVQLKSAVAQGEVLEYLRKYAFLVLYNDVSSKKSMSSNACRRIVAKDLKNYDDQGFVRVRVDFDSGEHRTLSWRFEQGHWRLMGYVD